jgi:putative PIN family toxin of toxin-antitoxin system
MTLYKKSDELRIVMDTNIIISALIGKHGEPAKLFEKLIKEEIENYTSSEIIQEVIEVLNREEITKRTNKESRQFILEQYLIHSKLIEPKTKHTLVEHKSDNKFIDTAIEAKAKFIISGDKHLLYIKEFKGVEIITAKKYLEQQDKFE